MLISEVDMLWSVVAPEGDYFYLGGPAPSYNKLYLTG